eukprot:TRINITY_DN2250_c0_g3_i1.p1 TRINITY_DN2250_c0_g3~~TRINITY_DN2250_c0_g3_i1.p1  ORF type:complete len:712 (+),score=303.65 TRINITY_DN2250_c0_g3_i1:55-2190(+)
MPVDGGPQRGPRRPASAASAPRDVRMQVAVRVRPDADSAVLVDATDVSLASKKDVVYSFDQVFSGGQEEVYAAYGKPMMDDAVDGYNTCLFAYGQTGSGKTYTLLGMPGAGLPAGADADAAAHGLLPRFLEDVAAYRQRKMVQNPAMQITLAMSVLEIYNEDLRDLLRPKPADGAKPAAPPCLVQDQETKETVVSGAAEIPIDSGEHALSLLRMGVASRQTAATDMNDVSSRSHMIVLVTLKQRQPDSAATTVSNIRFVDLAGSECLARTKAEGMRRVEGSHINQSLLALGKALNQFAAGTSKEVMKGMLRESKLTHLLSENFGGNSKTRMLAMVSPLAANEQQTASTLSYALRAKNITLHAKLNRRKDQHADAGRVRQLEKALHETKAEVERLVQEASQQDANAQQLAADLERQRKVAHNRATIAAAEVAALQEKLAAATARAAAATGEAAALQDDVARMQAAWEEQCKLMEALQAEVKRAEAMRVEEKEAEAARRAGMEEQLTQAAAARASLEEELRRQEEIHAEEVEDLKLKEAELQRALHLVSAAEEAGAPAAEPAHPAQPPAKRRRTKVLAPKREVEQQVQRKISTTQPTTAELTQEYLKGDLQQEVLKVEATEQRRQAAVRGNHALQSEVARLQNELRAAKAENESLRGLLDKAKPNDSAPPPLPGRPPRPPSAASRHTTSTLTRGAPNAATRRATPTMPRMCEQ